MYIIIQSIVLFCFSLQANENKPSDTVHFYRYSNSEIGFKLDPESEAILSSKMPDFISWKDILKKIDPDKLGREPGSGKVFSITSGIPLLMPMSCTSFPVLQPYTGQLMMATAAHCIFGSDPEKYSDYATSGNSIMGVQNYLAKGINISGDYHKEYSFISDTILTAIPEDEAENFGKDNAFEMAEKLPERGDIIYMEGYKGYSIPLVGGLTWGTRVSCVYMGKFYDFHSKPVFKKAKSVESRFNINEYAYCPKGLAGPGMSGGPTTDSEGKVIGINSSHLLLDNAANMDYDVYVFSSLTKSDYEPEDQKNLLPIRDGYYKFANVSSLSQDFKLYKGKMCMIGGSIRLLSANFKNGYLDGQMVSKFQNTVFNAYTYFDMGIAYRIKATGPLKTEADFMRDDKLRSPCDPDFDPQVDARPWYGGLFSALEKDYGPNVEDRFAKMDKEVWKNWDDSNEMYREQYEKSWEEMNEKYKNRPQLRKLGPHNRVLRNYLKSNDD